MKKMMFIVLMMLIALSFTSCTSEKGSEQYSVEIKTRDGGSYYTEVVTAAQIDDITLPTSGTVKINLKGGEHRIVWSYANINGYGMHLNERTDVKNVIIDSDCYIVIAGGEITIGN